MPHSITLIPGDGTGPEITEATVRVLEATGVQFDWDVKEAGIGAAEQYGSVLPDEVLESIRHNKVALVIVRENTEDLYAGVEFERGDPAIAQVSRITEAAGMGPIREDAGLSLKIISEYGSERIVRYAFEYARRFGRKTVTAV